MNFRQWHVRGRFFADMWDSQVICYYTIVSSHILDEMYAYKIMLHLASYHQSMAFGKSHILFGQWTYFYERRK